MARSSIPVDLRNPGQVFACLGLMEAAEILCGGAMAGFDWSVPARPVFHLEADGDRPPVERVLAFLAEAEIVALAPDGSVNRTEKWQVSTEILPVGAAFPFADPDSPATLPARLQDKAAHTIVVDYWGDATRRDNVKFWAGSGGFPGAGLLRDALDLARPLLREAVADPFAVSELQSSSFRFDFRRDYVPIAVGFSPNDHSAMTMRGYPLVEILAAIGVANARPERINKLAYRYGVIAPPPGSLLPPTLLRAALGAVELPFPRRTFRMRLDWPGQENQARCITDITEEPAHDRLSR